MRWTHLRLVWIFFCSLCSGTPLLRQKAFKPINNRGDCSVNCKIFCLMSLSQHLTAKSWCMLAGTYCWHFFTRMIRKLCIYFFWYLVPANDWNYINELLIKTALHIESANGLTCSKFTRYAKKKKKKKKWGFDVFSLSTLVYTLHKFNLSDLFSWQVKNYSRYTWGRPG